MSNGFSDYYECMNKSTFGTILAKIRMSKNISAYELSIKLEKDVTYISKIENGKAFPSMEMFFKICTVLDIPPADILCN